MFGKTDAHVFYYDCQIVNNSDAPAKAEINDTRARAVLDVPEEWEMSVVRFDLNTSLIPPSSIPMAPGAVLGVLSPSELSFTFRYLGVDTQAFVQNDTLGEIFGIDKLLDQMNTCLAGLHAGLAPPPASSQPPILAYDPLTQIITMYFEDVYATVGDIEVWCNFKTREKLTALPIETFAGFNQPLGKDFRLCFTCGSAKNGPPLVAGIRDNFPVITNIIPDPMRYIAQEAVVISSWNTTRSIKLVTASIPVIAEMEPRTTQLTGQGSFSNTTSNTISDFLMSSIDNPLADRIMIEYLPTASFRMVALQGRQELTRINIQALFTTLNGQTNPVFIPPNGIFSVKLMFRLKPEREYHK